MGDSTDSGRRLRAKERKMYRDQDIDDDEIEGKRNYSILDKLHNNQCHGNFVQSMKGEEFTLKHVQEHGLQNPIVFYEKTGLGMRVPSENFKVAEVKQCVGSRRMLDVMDVNTQRGMEMSMKDWVRYYENPERDRLLNVISLEFSHTRLANYVESPTLVRQVDWVDRVWPRHLKECQTESTNVIDKMKYPKVQKYCLMSVGGCYTDFHIDFGGTSVWYHILHGEKVFWLIPPSDKNIAIYENWVLSGKQGDVFLADHVEQCEMITLKAGYTFIIPSGWIHAVYTPIDSLVFGGNFIHSFNILQQLRVAEVEDRTHVPQKFRYPFYNEILWYVLERYVCCLTGKSYLKKQERKKEEIIEEPPDSPNSSQFDEDSRPPSRNPDPLLNPDDGDASKGKTDKDDTDKLSQRLTIELRRIDESSIKKTNEEGESGVMQRSHRKGAGELLKGGDYSDDSSSEKDFLKSVNGSGDIKEKKRVYLTRYELDGLLKLVEWIENFPVHKRVIPKDLLNPDAVLQDIKQLLVDHMNDDPVLSITGEPICSWPEAEIKKIKLYKPKSSGPKSAKGSSKQAAGNRRRRTRCKKCEACTRSDCEECNFCKDMRKFGGPGRMKQSCISRQCMAPVLPNTATCMICEEDHRVKLPDSDETSTTLMECGICWEIVHPDCLKKKFEQVDAEGIVNEDLPSSWECPKCCQDGKQGQIKPRAKPKCKIESRRSSEASESAYETDEYKIPSIEGKRVVSKETPSPAGSPQPGTSNTSVVMTTPVKKEEPEKKPQISAKKHKATPIKDAMSTPSKKIKLSPVKSVKLESPSATKRSGRLQKHLPGDDLDLNIKRPKRESISPESQKTDSPSTTRGQRRARTKTDSPNPKSRGDRRREPDGAKPRGTETFSLSKAGTSNKSTSQKQDANRPSDTKVPKLRKGDTQGPLAVGDKDKELRVVLEKHVVRPAPLPPLPSHVELANGKKHCLNRLLWMKVFAYLEESELCLCMAICKTWNRWCLDRKLWKTLDLSRKRLKQVHLIGIVKRQPSNLVLVSSVISQKQLVWLVSRLPQLQTLDLTYCSWATICGLCSASCPFLKSLLLKWAVGIRENCFRDLVLPPVDGKPGLNQVSRLIRLRHLDLSGCEITDQSLELIVEYMPRLETLGLSYCMRLTDEGIEKLFLESSPLRSSLSELQLSGCCQLSEKSVILAFKSCASLTSLRCKNCPKISQEMCQSFVDSFSQRRLLFSTSNMVITVQ